MQFHAIMIVNQKMNTNITNPTSNNKTIIITIFIIIIIIIIVTGVVDRFKYGGRVLNQ
jgi:hypothetical protein